MKLSGKPMSSPGRAEKYYPPPLMRFLRSNVGSRSRGRSRASPMFVRKKNTAIDTQEPSSPKVTCMGQVRVRRCKQARTNSNSNNNNSYSHNHNRNNSHNHQPGHKPKCCRCKWIPDSLFCRHLDGKLKVKSFKPSWGKWVLFFHPCGSFKRKSKIREDSSKDEPRFGNNRQELEQESVGHQEEEEEEEEEEEAKVYVSSIISPPKNALLLTRCRSAPYRSSSLACRFWGSPLGNEEETVRKLGSNSTDEENREDTTENPASKRESFCKESDQDSKLGPESEEKLGLFEEFEGSDVTSIREGSMKPAKIAEEVRREDDGCSVRPLILTRCKSEPARTAAEKLDPEMSFWKKRSWKSEDIEHTRMQQGLVLVTKGRDPFSSYHESMTQPRDSCSCCWTQIDTSMPMEWKDSHIYEGIVIFIQHITQRQAGRQKMRQRSNSALVVRLGHSRKPITCKPLVYPLELKIFSSN